MQTKPLTLAIVLLVIAVALGIYFFFSEQKDAVFSVPTGKWIQTVSERPEFIDAVLYNSSWKVEPLMYSSAGEVEQGYGSSMAGYLFTLPSGAKILWGGPQSSCTEATRSDLDRSVFRCVKGLRANLGHDSVALTDEDKRAFEDFARMNP
jgi:hypothetical protein